MDWKKIVSIFVVCLFLFSFMAVSFAEDEPEEDEEEDEEDDPEDEEDESEEDEPEEDESEEETDEEISETNTGTSGEQNNAPLEPPSDQNQEQDVNAWDFSDDFDIDNSQQNQQEEKPKQSKSTISTITDPSLKRKKNIDPISVDILSMELTNASDDRFMRDLQATIDKLQAELAANNEGETETKLTELDLLRLQVKLLEQKIDSMESATSCQAASQQETGRSEPKNTEQDGFLKVVFSLLRLL